MPVNEPIARNSITDKHLNIGKRGSGASATASSSGNGSNVGSTILAHYGIETAQNLVITNGTFPTNYPLKKLNFPLVLKESADVTLAHWRYTSTTVRDVIVTAFIECNLNAALERHVLHIFRKHDTATDIARQIVAVVDGTTLTLSVTAQMRLWADDELFVGVSVLNKTGANATLVVSGGQVKVVAV